MKKLILFVVLVSILAGNRLQAQDPVARKYGDLITQSDLKDNLSIIASDALEGRETGKRGQKMAAAFIKAHFEDLGLTAPVNGNSYYQPVELYTTAPGDIYIRAGQQKFMNFEDVVFYGNGDSGGEVSLPLVFAGKGRKEDFDQLGSVENKAVVILLENKENFRDPMSVARERKARMVLLWNNNADAFKDLVNQFRGYLNGGGLSVKKPEPIRTSSGTFFISAATATQVLNQPAEMLLKAANEPPQKGALKKVKPGTLTYKTATDIKVVMTDNVLGYLEGTDKKDELVVITAHYDHIGKRSGGTGDLINNGADDDGSGTVSVMQLAKAFAAAKKEGKGPRRSMLFMLVTGEEKGLLGSDYYTQHPVFPLEKTVVDLNIDMVGRRDPQHKDSAPYVYVIGSDKLSTELHNINENQNKAYTNLIFDYTYNDQNHPDRLYYRSDHWNFAKNNIPIIFYFDGIHEDYHQPSDEVSKIEFDLLAKRAQCVFYTAWDIANREGRLVVDKKK